jgi:hypothetical protein
MAQTLLLARPDALCAPISVHLPPWLGIRAQSVVTSPLQCDDGCPLTRLKQVNLIL